MFVDHGEGVLYLAFVTDIAGYTGRCARPLSPCSLRSLLNAIAILIEKRDPVTAPGAKQSGGAADTTTPSGNDDEP